MKSNIWYRSTPAVSVPAWEDRGALSFGDGTFHFAGGARTVSGSILSVGRAQMGINRWVHVRFEDQGHEGDAYFMDGGLLGWAGTLGGNGRLAAALSAAS
ncbi:hypothetical protein ACQEU3_04790 [Spirillospora sp. CA-253888]